MVSPPPYKEIINKNSAVRIVEGNIFHIKWTQNVELEIPDVDEVNAAFLELTNGETVKVLSQFGNYVNITSEARDYAANKSPRCIALAYVVTGLAQRMVIRFYIRLRKRQNPTKVFNSYDDALAWLKTM